MCEAARAVWHGGTCNWLTGFWRASKASAPTFEDYCGRQGALWRVVSLWLCDWFSLPTDFVGFLRAVRIQCRASVHLRQDCSLQPTSTIVVVGVPVRNTRRRTRRRTMRLNIDRAKGTTTSMITLPSAQRINYVSSGEVRRWHLSDDAAKWTMQGAAVRSRSQRRGGA